jgi:integrase
MNTTKKRGSPGAGSVFGYKTAGGIRYGWQATLTQPDGTRKRATKGGFETKKAAQEDLRDNLVAAKKGELVQPSKRLFGEYAREVIDGMRVGPSTRASYLKNWRLHLAPYPVAQVPLAQLTGAGLTTHYRLLERTGRKDHRSGTGLSARTVRYLHQMLNKVLDQAVRDNLLPRNPANTATPPTAKEARPPEMRPWSASQLGMFLNWSAENSELHAAWHVLAHTGMRRGELLGLTWSDVDLDAATVSIQRSAGLVRNAGEEPEILVTAPKTEKSRRVIDIDPSTVAVLRSWKAERGSLALKLARPEAKVFGTEEDKHRHPERFSRLWNQTVARAIRKQVDVPPIRLHDLRHTHATVLLQAGEPVKTVSERLGHGSATITLTVYGHVMPGDQKRAASRFADLVAAGR